MAKHFSVETHPQREKLIHDIINRRGSPEAIARKYHILASSVWNYLRRSLLTYIQKADETRQLSTAEAIMGKLESEIAKLEKLEGALDAFLRDPDDPSKYTNDVNAQDIDVIYTQEEDDGKGGVIRNRRRATLSEIVKQHIPSAFQVQIKREDSRRIFIDLHRAIGDELDRLAKILGLVKDVKIQITRTETWSFVMNDVNAGLERYEKGLKALIETTVADAAVKKLLLQSLPSPGEAISAVFEEKAARAEKTAG